ncbi:MAG TPA: hypothetical protein VGP36_07175 [Mycobacteriales bacterium]|jgi:hypothetical protein|nr:hypothetical protein [Mycobacteriales bacterium]
MARETAEIKMTVAAEQVPRAIGALGLPAEPEQWEIYFFEDLTTGLPTRTPLLDAGIVLRFRRRGAKGPDSTAKLRPCRRSQLTDRWLAAGKEDGVKIQADWAGDRHVLAVSVSADRDGLDPAGPVETLFTAGQRQFLADCAVARVNLAAVSVLPPVDATRWPDYTARGIEIQAERWIAGPLDFLELSTVAALDEAVAARATLESYARAAGLDIDAVTETKTRLVLNQLVTAAAPV